MCGPNLFCDFGPNFLADLKLPQIYFFPLKNIGLKCTNSNLTLMKHIWRNKPEVQFGGFAMKGPKKSRHFYKKACWLIITNFRISDSPNGTKKKFADLRYWNQPKNLRICDNEMSLRICGQIFYRAHLWLWVMGTCVYSFVPEDANYLLTQFARQP